MATMRVRKVATQREFDEFVDDLITQGYKVVSSGNRTAQLKRPNWGSASMHILIFLFFGWWTLGFFNAVYALVANSGAERVLVKVTGE